MIRRFSINFAIFSMFFDALLISIALFLADFVRPYLNQFDFIKYLTPSIHIPTVLFPIFVVIWVLVLILFSVYDGRKNIKVTQELINLTLGVFLASIASAGSLYLSFRNVSRALFLTFVILSYSFLTIWRGIYRLLLRIREFESIVRRVLIIGAGGVGFEVREQITKHSRFGLRFIGFLDDEVDAPEVKGYLKDTRRVVEEFSVDDVVIALPRQAYQRVNQLVSELHDLPIRVWIIPDYYSLVLHEAVIEEYAGIPMLDLRAPALNDYQRLVKRIFDLIFILVFSPLILMVFGIVAMAIKIFDPGPILFIQDRVGENGKIFKFYKFRSMIIEAERKFKEIIEEENQGKPIQKTPDDPRITKLGKILRRTSLDEFPQFINVLKGEMSLVGPRPELPYLVEKYEPWQRKRFAMPPGITGWWQIEGRSDRPMHLHTEDDLYYVKNYSIWLDIIILIKTVGVVIRGKGAY